MRHLWVCLEEADEHILSCIPLFYRTLNEIVKHFYQTYALVFDNTYNEINIISNGSFVDNPFKEKQRSQHIVVAKRCV